MQHAQADALRATLAAMGAPSALEPAGIDDAIAGRRAELVARIAPPAIAYWLGEANTIRLWLPSLRSSGSLALSITLESGGTLGWAAQPAARRAENGLHAVDVQLPPDLPAGYHQLSIALAGHTTETLIIAAPTQAYQPGPPNRWWGTFLPLYALRTERPWHAGDYTDLGRLVTWTGGLGGQLVGTLPLLAGFLEGQPFDYSPYAPASRLAWNELYIDVGASPEFGRIPAAKALVQDAAFGDALTTLAERRMVDYSALYRLKRQALEPLAAELLAPGGERRLGELRHWVQNHPLVEEYARFRAVGEHRGAPWQAWPEAPRAGHLSAGDYDPAVAHFHQYVQWLADTQIAAAAPADGLAGLYMDLPLGVHASGFDTWRFPATFADGASTGAPPDGLFIGGQDWGFPPPHPERLRETGYRYFIEVVRHHMRHARVLRIDHVMGLYRQFWIPQGFPATEGVYVRYPADELAAVVCLESHRNACAVVGENLGTVPAAVERLLERRGFRPMYVAEFAATGNPAAPLPAPASDTLAAIGTHDTPTFAGWWYGLDIHDKLDLGLVDAEQAQAEHAGREQLRTAIEAFVTRHEADRSPDDPPLTRWLAGTLRHLADTDAWAVLVNLEDLLLELQPQNVPGTHRERPNWLRKASTTLEAVMADPTVASVLAQVARARSTQRR